MCSCVSVIVVLCGRDLPALPLYHWSRAELVARVTRALLTVSDAPAPVISPFQQLLSMTDLTQAAAKARTIAPTLVALCGRSGVGKTTVAIEAIVCHPEIRRFFNGCVVWLNVRKNPSTLALLSCVEHHLSSLKRSLPAVRALTTAAAAVAAADRARGSVSDTAEIESLNAAAARASADAAHAVASVEAGPPPSPIEFTTLAEAQEHLCREYENFEALIVLDDVWERKVVSEVVQCLPHTSGTIKFLLTTVLEPERVRGLHPQIRVIPVDDQMTESEWVGLQAMCLARPYESMPIKRARELTALTSTSPLALSLVALSQNTFPMTDDHHWVEVLNRVKIQKQVSIAGYDNQPKLIPLCKALAFSVKSLSADLHSYFLDFAVFPDGIWVPESVLLRFWTKRTFYVKKPKNPAANSALNYHQHSASVFGLASAGEDFEEMKTAVPSTFATASTKAHRSGGSNAAVGRTIELNPTQILSIIHTLLCRNLLQRRVLQDNTVCYSLHEVIGAYVRQRAAAEGIESKCVLCFVLSATVVM